MRYKGIKRRSTLDGRTFEAMAALHRFLESDKTFTQSFIWFTGCLSIFFLVSLSATGAFISTYQKDYLFVIEQGWRLAQGQLPYRDFISPIGPLYYALIGGVQYLSSGAAGAYRLTGFLAMLFVGPGLIWMAWRRLSANIAIFVALYFALIPVSPRELDGLFFDFSYLALYNSLCWPLIAIVMLGALFNPFRDKGPRYAVMEGLLIGLAITALLALKITHGISALGISVVGLLVRPNNRSALIVALLCAVGIAAINCAFAPDLLERYIANLVEIGQSNNLTDRIHSKMQNIIYHETATFLASFFAFWVIEKYRQYHPRKVSYADVAAVGTIFLVTYADTLNDNEDTLATVPLLFLALWLVARSITLPIDGPVGDSYRRVKTCLLSIPFLLWAGLPIANDSLAIVFHSISFWLRPATSWPSNLPIASDLRHLKLPGSLGTEPLPSLEKMDERSAYLLALKQGVSELQRLHLDRVKIYETRFDNTFSWLLQAPSPKGVLAWLDVGRTFSETAHPPADTYLHDVDVLMVSKLPSDTASTKLFWNIYGSNVSHDFELVSETECWRIYRRRNS